MGNHASSSHAGGMYIFISFPQTNPMWFQPNISQPQMGIFQPQSININHNNSNQPFAINQFSHQSQPINIVHGLWTRGVYICVYIYIFIYSNSLLFQHIYNFYNAYITYTSNVQLIQRLYKRCTTLI